MSSQPDTMTVFDRHLVRQRRDRAARRGDEYSFLFMEGGERLSDRLADINRTFPLVLDLGAHNGHMADVLSATQKVHHLVQSDLSIAMAKRAATRGLALAADEEALPFAAQTFDAIVSNLSMHWINDLPGALVQIRQALKPDGLFLASVFGGETLRELRGALSAAEIELEGGLSPRISPFADVRDLGALLQRAGFALPVVDTETITVSYANPLRLLDDLRGMGESNAVIERRKTPLRRATLMAAMAKYVETHRNADGRVPATFEVLTMTAWSPADNQQKPLQPGSASRRLADALGSEEVSLGEKARPKE